MTYVLSVTLAVAVLFATLGFALLLHVWRVRSKRQGSSFDRVTILLGCASLLVCTLFLSMHISMAYELARDEQFINVPAVESSEVLP